MSVVARMDRVVNAFVARCRWFHEPLNEGRAKMFAMQHRLNTRQRNRRRDLTQARPLPYLGGIAAAGDAYRRKR